MIHRTITAIDAPLLRLIRSLPAGVKPTMELASLVGQPVAVGAFVGAAGLGYFLGGHVLQAVAASLAIGAILAGNVLKVLFRRTRPDTYIPLLWHSYSFPSGHAAGSFVGFGLFAWLAAAHLPLVWGGGVGVVLAGLTLLIGVSRVYLGAHYPTDILGGWAAGAVMLAAIIMICAP